MISHLLCCTLSIRCKSLSSLRSKVRGYSRAEIAGGRNDGGHLRGCSVYLTAAMPLKQPTLSEYFLLFGIENSLFCIESLQPICVKGLTLWTKLALLGNYICNDIRTFYFLWYTLLIFSCSPGCCYETAMTRYFYHGRTETVRSCTVEAVRWCQSMQDPSVSVSIGKEKTHKICFIVLKELWSLNN